LIIKDLNIKYVITYDAINKKNTDNVAAKEELVYIKEL
jgi:hypothetical protein